jgi:hypothetical protein
MSLIDQVASTVTETRVLGGKKQKLTAPVKTFFLAKGDFNFASQTLFENKGNWDTAINAEDIIPTPNIEALEDANKEATIKEGRFDDLETREGVAGVRYRIDCSNTFYKAFKTYKGSEYDRVFVTSTKEEHMCEVADDGAIYGRKISSMTMSMFMEATDEEPSHFFVTFKFKSDDYNTRVTPFEATELEGIHELVLTSVSDSASSRKFTVTSVSTGKKVTSLEQANFLTKDETGTVTSTTFVAADSEGVYEVTGTFATGHTIEVNGVIANPTIRYKGTNILTQA